MEADGCRIDSQATLQGGTFSGSCLSALNVNLVPVAIISATPLTGEIPLTVALSASGSSDSDGTIQSYLWTFPDGTTESGVSLEREFTAADAYTIKLTVTDNDGAMGEAQVVITATAPLISPTASFSFTPESGDAPLTVSFDGSESSDPDGSIVTYQWFFDDGETLEGEGGGENFFAGRRLQCFLAGDRRRWAHPRNTSIFH